MTLLTGKKEILLISKNRVLLISVNRKNQSQVLLESQWSIDTFDDLVKSVSKHTSSLRILLSDDLAYVALVSIPEDRVSKKVSLDIEEKVLSIFPESKENLVWDYKFSHTSNDKSHYQVVGIPKDFLSRIIEKFESKKISIENIEPISCSIVRSVTAKDDFSPRLVVYASQIGSYLIYAKGDVVVFSRFLSTEDNFDQEFQPFLDFIETNFEEFHAQEAGPIEVYNSSEFYISNESELIGHKIIKHDVRLDPFVEMYEKHNITGKDEDVLNLDVREEKNKVADAHPEHSGDSADGDSFVKTYRLHIMVVFLIMLMALAGFMVYGYLNRDLPASSSTNIPTQISPEVEIVEFDDNEQAPEAGLETSQVDGLELDSGVPEDLGSTPTEVSFGFVEEDPEADANDFSRYRILILNGSGVPGEAGRLRDLLSDAGFLNIVTDNAEDFDYELTEIRVSNNVLPTAIDLMGDTLNARYRLSFPGDFYENEQFDVEIIVGRPIQQ